MSDVTIASTIACGLMAYLGWNLNWPQRFALIACWCLAAYIGHNTVIS